MKCENFDLHSVEGASPTSWIAVAEVDVTEGIWRWKKTTRRKIRKEYACAWHFTDNGKFTPGDQIEELVRVWEAKNYKIFRKK